MQTPSRPRLADAGPGWSRAGGWLVANWRGLVVFVAHGGGQVEEDGREVLGFFGAEDLQGPAAFFGEGGEGEVGERFGLITFEDAEEEGGGVVAQDGDGQALASMGGDGGDEGVGGAGISGDAGAQDAADLGGGQAGFFDEVDLVDLRRSGEDVFQFSGEMTHRGRR